MNRFTKDQLKAINSNSSHILCIAGAGAGKTTVLTHRVARIINNKKAKPENILCLTFTRNAGMEMKQRILKLINNGQDLFCNTFHSFCIDILKKFGYLLGYTEFSIYNEDEKIELIKSIFIDLGIFYDINDIGKKDIEKVLQCLKNGHSLNENSDINNYIRIAEEYKYRLKKYSSVDLDMLLDEALKLLKDYTEVQEYYNKKYKYCFVDEYQDCSAKRCNMKSIA